MVVVTVILCHKPLAIDYPRATNGELLRVGALPNFDLVDITLRKTCGGHLVSEGLAVIIGAILAHKEIFLTAHDNLKVSDEVSR